MSSRVEVLDEGIWTVSGILTADECSDMISRGEALGFERADVRTSSGPQTMTNIRNSGRVAFDDPDLARLLWERIRDFVPREIEGCRVAGLYEHFRFYRYGPGERFRRHKDGVETSRTGERSRFSFLIYLNTGCEGGETIFSDYSLVEGKNVRHEIRVVPEVGMGLFFVHHRWHEGAPVTSGRKYVLRTDVLYETDQGVDR